MKNCRKIATLRKIIKIYVIYIIFAHPYLIDCYENNDPHDVEANHSITFHNLWQATIDCFSKYTNESIISPTPNPNSTDDKNFEDQVKKVTAIFTTTTGSLCTNCSEVYDKMRQYFWTHVVPSNDKETIGGVCYDIRDAVSVYLFISVVQKT